MREGTITLQSGKFVEIIIDDSADSPRHFDGENITKMVCFHRRYNLGDKTNYKNEDFEEWSSLKKMILQEEKAVIIKPLYLLDHSGLSIKTSPFSCQWDSGIVGYVYIPRGNIDKLGIIDPSEEKLEEALDAEVKIYNNYLQGEVFGFRVYDYEDGEELDSRWGFYGDHITSGIFEAICDSLNKREAKELADILGVDYDVELDDEPEREFSDEEIITLKKLKKISEQALKLVTSEKLDSFRGKFAVVIADCENILQKILIGDAV